MYERLKHFPVSFFSVVMGLTGAAISLQKLEAIFALGFLASMVVIVLSLLIFTAILGVYLLKICRHFAAVIAEFQNPIHINFFPAISISLLLLGSVLMPIYPTIGFYFAAVGACLQIVFSAAIISEWVRQSRFEIKHMNPSWFIPAVGNILMPLAGAGVFLPIVCWFFFSVGIFFWVVLQVIFFYRIIFHHPLPEKLVPTLFILIAPPAVAFLSYYKLTGTMDNVATFFISIALFLFLLLLFMGKLFLQTRFFLSWWAYSFPLAALSTASLVYYQHSGIVLVLYFASIIMSLLLLLLVFLVGRTILAMARREICVEE